MAAYSIVKVSPAAYPASERAAFITAPNVDPAHFTAPTTGGSFSAFADANGTEATRETNQAAGQAAAGKLLVKFNGIVYAMIVLLNS